MLGSLLSIVIVLVIVGLILYLVETYIPMSPPFRMIIRVVVILGLCIFLLSLLTGGLGTVRMHLP